MGWENFLSWKRKFHCVGMSNRVVCERKLRYVAKILGGGGKGGGGGGWGVQALSTSYLKEGEFLDSRKAESFVYPLQGHADSEVVDL